MVLRFAFRTLRKWKIRSRIVETWGWPTDSLQYWCRSSSNHQRTLSTQSIGSTACCLCFEPPSHRPSTCPSSSTERQQFERPSPISNTRFLFRLVWLFSSCSFSFETYGPQL